MKDLAEKMKIMLLKECNRKVTEFNEICNYLSQYSQANTFLIPKKYQETITNELNQLEIPLVFDIKETDNPDLIILTLFNYGAVQRENILKELKK